MTNAVKAARSVCGFSLRIDVEVQSHEEAVEAIQAGADIIMLDNMEGDKLIACANKLKHDHAQHKFLLESSGGINLDNVAQGGHVDNGTSFSFGECSADSVLTASAWWIGSDRYYQHELDPPIDSARRL